MQFKWLVCFFLLIGTNSGINILNFILQCQSAALDELFGNPEDCFNRYQTAQILLHSLAQKTSNSQDKTLLSKCKLFYCCCCWVVGTDLFNFFLQTKMLWKNVYLFCNNKATSMQQMIICHKMKKV